MKIDLLSEEARRFEGLLRSEWVNVGEWVEAGARLFVLNADPSLVREAFARAGRLGGNGWESYWLARVAFFWESDSELAVVRSEEALGVLGPEPAALALRAAGLQDLQRTHPECCDAWARAHVLAPCWPSIAYGYGDALLRAGRAVEFLALLSSSDRIIEGGNAEEESDEGDPLAVYCRSVIMGRHWPESRARLLQMAPIRIRRQALARS